jgi:hypothetical protein
MHGQAMIDRATAYVKSALTDAADKAAIAPPGKRNSTLFREAAAVAQFLHLGVITKEDWRQAFMAAGEQAGLDTFEIHDTLNSALKTGTGTPRDLPDNMINGQVSYPRQTCAKPDPRDNRRTCRSVARTLCSHLRIMLSKQSGSQFEIIDNSDEIRDADGWALCVPRKMPGKEPRSTATQRTPI